MDNQKTRKTKTAAATGPRSAPLSAFIARCIATYAVLVAVSLAVVFYVVVTDESTFWEVLPRLWTTNYYMTAHAVMCYATVPLVVAICMGEGGVVLCREIAGGKRSKVE